MYTKAAIIHTKITITQLFYTVHVQCIKLTYLQADTVNNIKHTVYTHVHVICMYFMYLNNVHIHCNTNVFCNISSGINVYTLYELQLEVDTPLITETQQSSIHKHIDKR